MGESQSVTRKTRLLPAIFDPLVVSWVRIRYRRVSEEKVACREDIPNIDILTFGNRRKHVEKDAGFILWIILSLKICFFADVSFGR